VRSRVCNAIGAAAGVNRRAVLHGLAGAGLVGLAGRTQAADALTATSVAPGVTLLAGAGGNVLVVATEAGKVLVDSGAASHTAPLLAAVDALPGGEVAALFNTHWHLDQIGGNEALGSAGATIFAHAKTRQRLTTGYYLPTEDRYEAPLAPSGRPTEAFHSEATTTLGKRRIDYGYLLEAHTDGDIYVAFPDVDVIAVGDVLAPVQDPVFDWFGGGWLGGRLDALARLLEVGNESTRFVPSYGPAVGLAELQAENEVLLKIYDLMVEHVRLGESAADMAKAGLLDGLGRKFADPAKLLYDLHKGFWAHHNALMHDIV
jgi:cyclase